MSLMLPEAGISFATIELEESNDVRRVQALGEDMQMLYGQIPPFLVVRGDIALTAALRHLLSFPLVGLCLVEDDIVECGKEKPMDWDEKDLIGGLQGVEFVWIKGGGGEEPGSSWIANKITSTIGCEDICVKQGGSEAKCEITTCIISLLKR